MKLFVHQNGETAGPFPLETVERMNLTPDTLVWREGMETWQKASKVAELAHLFVSAEPPVPPQNLQPQTPPTQPQPPLAQPQYGGAGGYGMPPQFPAQPAPELIYDHPRCMTRSIIATVLASLGILTGISAPFILLFAVPALILGILGITNSNSSDDAYANGNGQLGRSLYNRAKNYANISLILFVVSIIVLILIIFFATALIIGLSNDRYY